MSAGAPSLGPQRAASLRASLSGLASAASAAATSAAALDPALRGLQHQQPHAQQLQGTFAARMALDPASPQDSLELFKRLRRGQGRPEGWVGGCWVVAVAA